jgi:hypothetical protein
MPTWVGNPFWRTCRRVVRWCRIACLAGVLAFLIGLIYLNRVGLPDWMKNRLVAELRGHGLDLDFRRVRLHWWGGFVAENINLGKAGASRGPQLNLDEAELRFNFPALRHRQLQVDSLIIRRGRLIWPLAEAQPPAPPLVLEDITTELRFLPHDQWELDRFQARLLNAKLRLFGSLTNAPLVRRWTAPRGTNASSAVWQSELARVLRVLGECQCPAPPEFHLAVRGDARDLTTFSANLSFRVASLASPWAVAEQFQCISQFTQPPGSNGLIRLHLDLRADRLRSASNSVRNLSLTGDFLQWPTQAIPGSAQVQFRADQVRHPQGVARRVTASLQTRGNPGEDRIVSALQFDAADLRGPWGQARRPSFSLHCTHDLTRTNTEPTKPDRSAPPVAWFKPSWLPQQAEARLALTPLETRWGKASNALVHLVVSRDVAAPPVAPRLRENPWTWIEPFLVRWDTDLGGLQITNLFLERAQMEGQWKTPRLAVSRADVRLFGGRLSATGQWDVAERQLSAQSRLDFDYRQLAPWLSPGSRSWLEPIHWTQPPTIDAGISLDLPATTNASPRWPDDLWPRLRLKGQVVSGPGAFRQVPWDAVQARFTLTNALWTVPDLAIDSPAGTLRLAGQVHTDTRKFRGQVDSRINPSRLETCLEEGALRRALHLFSFTNASSLQGDFWGDGQGDAPLRFAGQAAAAHFTFRDQSYDSFSAFIWLTNKCLQATNIAIRLGEQSVDVPGLGFDLESQTIYLTNALCHLDPLVVTRAIGPKTTEAILPYQFRKPPTVRLSGSVPVRDADHPDLEFDVTGGPFHYWRFELPQLEGHLSWHGDSLVLTNIQAAFYRGRLTGQAAFDFSPRQGADFGFTAHVAEADFKGLVGDVIAGTNRLEGALTGNLVITHANSIDWQSWNGLGDVQLRDGLIWDIPLFGVFSPVLNGIWSGLGSSRAHQATATFTLTNSLIHTRNLEIRTPALRMHYEGTVDFDGQVRARMEASLLRNTWLVGRVFSVVFLPITKLFEYRVAGTLLEPKSEPLYLISRLLLKPLHPIRSVKELFSPTPAASTNRPPAAPPAPE